MPTSVAQILNGKSQSMNTHRVRELELNFKINHHPLPLNIQPIRSMETILSTYPFAPVILPTIDHVKIDTVLPNIPGQNSPSVMRPSCVLTHRRFDQFTQSDSVLHYLRHLPDPSSYACPSVRRLFLVCIP